MKITETIFEVSAASAKQFPEPTLPEIVFVGRSNVGKSSLLNSITGRKQLAKVSATPGKTQQINFFRINAAFRFADCPGYGFAEVAQSTREQWAKLIESYFHADRPLCLVILLVDSRLPLQAIDARMISWFIDVELPLQIVLTKIDKLTQKDRVRQGKELLASIRALGYGASLVPFSSLKGTGKNELLSIIATAATL